MSEIFLCFEKIKNKIMQIKLLSPKEIQALLDRASKPRNELKNMDYVDLKDLLDKVRDLENYVNLLQNIISDRVVRLEEIVDEVELEYEKLQDGLQDFIEQFEDAMSDLNDDEDDDEDYDDFDDEDFEDEDDEKNKK